MINLIKDVGRRKVDSENVIHWLATRETTVCSSSAAFLQQQRRLHLTILPNFSENRVNIPNQSFVRRFSPDGKILIAFSKNQLNVEVYQFRGSSAGNELYQNSCKNADAKNQIFEVFFVKICSIPVVSTDQELLNRECSVFLDSGRYVIVGSSGAVEGPFPHMYDTFRNNESLLLHHLFPLENYTVYLVDLHCGQVTDACKFKCDKIFLSHNQGLSLCGSRLAILSVQHQTVHLFELSAGAFIPYLDIGRFCYQDDISVYMYIESRNENESDPSGSTHWPFLDKWINSLKHRFLCRIMSQAVKQCTTRDSTPLMLFFRRFTYLASLRIWKMQMLDKCTLLLKYAAEDVVTNRKTDAISEPAFFAVYDIDSTDMIEVYENTSKDFLRLYERHADEFCSSVSQPLSAIICNVSNCPFTRAVHMEWKKKMTLAKNGGATEATKVLLSQLPVCAQSFTSSPYLDMQLFCYDEKFISTLEKPKLLQDDPLR